MASHTTKVNDYYALVVGVSRYPEKEFGDLGGPETDAQAFHDWVVSPGGGGVARNRAKLILSSQFKVATRPLSAKPTVEAIQRFFEQLHEVAKRNDENGEGLTVGRRLYLYFGGHGFMPADDETALLTANASVDLPHHVPGKAWANLFYRGFYFEEILLFMDCCRLPLARAIPNRPALQIAPNPMAGTNGKRFFAFACPSGRAARERVMAGGVSRGVFTTALLEGLRGGATNVVTGDITTGDLRNYLHNNMQGFLAPEDLKNPQLAELRPVIEPPLGEMRDFLVVRTPPTLYPIRVPLPESATGKTVNVRSGTPVDGSFPRVSTTTGAPPSALFSLPVGLYLIEVVGGDEGFRSFEVKAGEGVRDAVLL